MKKLLLAVCAFASVSSYAQTRFSIYEEFSGENCGPCAAANPGLWSLLTTGTNPSNVLLIKYQSPIPSAGPIYQQYTPDVQNRLTYYSVPFAPYGRLNGTNLGSGTAAPSSPGHVANLVQADLNAAASAAAPFNVSVSHVWNATGDTVTATVSVTSPSAYAPANAQLKLRVALIEHLVYDFPPGTNGETDFHNVVRRMYPDANGTTILNAWTMGQNQVFTIKGYVPSYIDKSKADTRIVAFIQNDQDKSIVQAAVSTPVLPGVDAASDALTIPANLICNSGSANVIPTVALKNTGTATLTSATIYYKVDNGSWQSSAWTGSLASNATANVALPAISIAAGAHVIYDSVATPNAMADINPANNVKFKQVWVQNTTPNALPFNTGFENAGTMPTNYMLYDVNGNFQNWQLVTGTSVGHNNSSYALRHYNYSFAAGESNVAIIPTPNMPAGAKALDFWYAYASFQAEADKLEVVYSTNCGQTWTALWNKAGSALATAPATTSSFVPTQSQWKFESVDMTNVPTAAMIGFRGTSDYGNNLFIDDVKLRTGLTDVNDVVASGLVRMYPNPAKDDVTIEFTVSKSANVSVQILDAMGRVVNNVTNEFMAAGVQKLRVNTASLASGLYNVKIQTEEGHLIERLSVVK